MAQMGQVIGGGRQQYQAVQPAAPQADSTSALLMKMAQPILQKQLEQEQQKQFVKGMQRVATGEAYADIKGEDSFLSNIFGPSATVGGAAAMAKVKSVDDFNTKMYQDMQGNAQMSPEQFRDHAVNGMNAFLTGDADVDNVVQSKMVESLGPLMKTQAKANYAWTQQQASHQYSGMIQSAGDTFHAQAIQKSQGLINDNDFQLAKGQLLLANQPVAGMNPETYKKALLDNATLAMTKGNMWVDRVFQESGMYDGLDADDQTKLEAARTAAAGKLKNEYGFNKYGAALGEIMGGAAGRSPAKNHEMINSINQRYMDETGSSSGLVTMKELVSMDRSSYSRLYAQQDKFAELRYKSQLDEAAAAKADGVLATQALEMVEAGAGKFAIAAGVPKNKVDQAFSSRFSSALGAGNDEQALGYAIGNYTHGNGYVNPQLSSMLTEPLRQITQGQVPGPEFDRSMQFLDKLSTMPESGGMIDAYVGAENVVKIARYRNALVAFQGDKQQAAKAAWGSAIVDGPRLSNADNKDTLLSTIAKKYDGKGVMNSIDRMWSGANNLTPASQDVIFNAVAEDATLYQNNLGMTTEAAFGKALEGPAAQKVDRAGQFAYRKTPDQLPLAALIGTDDRTVNLTFAPFLQRLARDQGVFTNIDGASDQDVGRADFFNKNTDLTNWYGGGDSDVSIQRHADAKDDKGNTYGVFSAILSRKGETAVVHFSSKDYKSAFEKLLKDRHDITPVLKRAGL